MVTVSGKNAGGPDAAGLNPEGAPERRRPLGRRRFGYVADAVHSVSRINFPRVPSGAPFPAA